MKRLFNGLLLPSFLALMLIGPVLAQTLPDTNAHPVSQTKPKVDLACMQNAVEKRDNAIITAWDNFYNAAKTALQARKDALKTAWANTDRKARRAATKSAWNNYRAAIQKARHDFHAARRAAWQQFYTDRKACGPKAARDDASHQGLDRNL